MTWPERPKPRFGCQINPGLSNIDWIDTKSVWTCKSRPWYHNSLGLYNFERVTRKTEVVRAVVEVAEMAREAEAATVQVTEGGKVVVAGVVA